MSHGFAIRPLSLIIFGVPIALIIIAIIFIVNKSRGQKISVLRESEKFIFISYLIMVAALTLFPIHSIQDGAIFAFRTNYLNLIPLKTIVYELRFNGLWGLRNDVGNLLLLLPFGFFVPLLFQRFRKLPKCLLCGFIISFTIEVLQLFEDYFTLDYSRATDIDDIILNVMGACIGFLIFKFVFKLIKTANSENKTL